MLSKLSCIFAFAANTIKLESVLRIEAPMRENSKDVLILNFLAFQFNDLLG